MSDRAPRRLRASVRRLAAASLLAALAFATPSFPSAWAGRDEDVAAAEALLAQGKAQEAVEAFRRLADAPGGEDPSIQAGLGRACVAAGDPESALPPLRTVARTRGTPADRILLAEALLSVARDRLASGPRLSIEVVPYLEDAQIEAREAGKDAALAPRRDRIVGEARWLLGDAAGARAALENPALAADAETQNLLGTIRYGSGDYAGAARAYRAAGNRRGAAAALSAAKDPGTVEAYAALLMESPSDADVYDEAVQAARFAGALAGLDAVLAALSTPPEARALVARARGRVAEHRSRPEEALAFFREVAALLPADAAAHDAIGRVLFAVSAKETAAAASPPAAATPAAAAALSAAVEEFLTALRLAPEDADARTILGYLAQADAAAAPAEWPDRTRLDRSVRVFAALAESDPADATAWANLGNARRLAGDPKGALEAFATAGEANPYDASVANDEGIARLGAGDRAGALAAFERAAGLDPGATAPHQNAARLRWLAGEDDAVEAHCAAALRSTRLVGGSPMTYRFLLDRVWRARRRPEVR